MKERPILFTGPMVRAILDGSKKQTRRIMKPQPEPTPSDYPGRAGHWWPSNIVQSMVHVEQELQNKHGGWGGFCPDVCPHGQIGDRLWVREAHQYYNWTDDGAPCIRYQADGGVAWPIVPGEKADEVEEIWADLSLPGNWDIDNHARDRKWRPSIHMPRWASRVLLEIVSVRVERLQDISEVDAIAEGATHIRSKAWDREHFPEWRYLFEEAVAAGVKPPIGPSPAQAYEKLWESINGAGSWDANPWVWVVEFKRVAG